MSTKESKGFREIDVLLCLFYFFLFSFFLCTPHFSATIMSSLLETTTTFVNEPTTTSLADPTIILPATSTALPPPVVTPTPTPTTTQLPPPPDFTPIATQFNGNVFSSVISTASDSAPVPSNTFAEFSPSPPPPPGFPGWIIAVIVAGFVLMLITSLVGYGFYRQRRRINRQKT